jgi:hypothetical protein
LVIPGFKVRASYSLGRCSTAWAMLPSPICSSYFGDRFLFFVQVVLDPSPLIFVFLSIAGMTGTHHCAHFFPLR